MTDSLVVRLARSLMEALRERGESAARPLTIGELHQELVPYRAVRSMLGVELNADYEHALLRLVAGEGGMLRVESDQAREELQREAEAVVPSVGLFRKFAAYEVRVLVPVGNGAPAAFPEPTPEPESEPEPELDAPTGDLPPGDDARPAGDGVRLEGGTPEEERGGVHGGGGPASLRIHRGRDPGEMDDGPPCFFCGEDLPRGRTVNFCPACGGDQRSRACSQCDTPLDRGWRYCITCGHPTAAL